jgi:hypothetical protein
MQKIFLILITIIPNFAYASYKDGFFAMGIMVIATPILILGLLITMYYRNKKWFYDRSFTIFYSMLWFVFFAISMSVISLASTDSSDDVSPVVIFWGLSIYYFFIVLPALMQYRSSKRL